MQDYLKYRFITNDDGTGTLFYYTLDEKKAHIPSVVAGFRMVAVGRWAFFYRDAYYERTPLEEVEFDEGYREIYHGAFYGCPKLKKISLPSTIEKMYGNPFEGCDSLTEIVFPNGNDRFRFEDGKLIGSDGHVYFDGKAAK